MQAVLHKLTIMRFLLPVLFLVLACLYASAESQPSLKFLLSGKEVNETSLSKMKADLSVHKIELYDPSYGKTKRFEGFSVQDVLKLGFGNKLNNADYTDVAFTALDGYMGISTVSKIMEKGGYIAFTDRDNEGWEPVGRQETDPGPFYLVWTGKNQTTKEGYPWPWQIASVDLMRFRDQYPLVYPKGAPEDSAAYRGYEIFKTRCVRCHAMNGQGGKIGPDLNAPKSIVTYRSEYMIKEMIKHPSEYRYTHMPDHPDLTDGDLDNIITYFRYMNSIGK